jgi:hypothetical protein
MKRACLTVAWFLVSAIFCSAQTTFYYPHVVNGVLGGTIWKTTVLLTNPAASGAATGTITFRRENSVLELAGSVFSTIAFTDQDGAPVGGGGTITFSIPAGETRKYTSTGAGAYAGGFATVTADASVNGTAIFSEFDLSGRLIAEAGVPAAAAVPNQAIFVDTQGGYNIGVAYANPGGGASSVSLSLLNSAAVAVATTTELLGPGNHSAKFTFQVFPGLPPLAGTLQIRSQAPLAAIALRADPSLSLYTTLPPVTIASLVSPVINWFEKRSLLAPLTSVARLLGALNLRLG